MRSQIDWLTLSPTAPQSRVLHRYQRLQHAPLGKWRFARAACSHTPLLAALQVQFEELRTGLCRAALPLQRRVRTFDGAVDPLALSALAQLAANMVIEVSVPEGWSWTMRGLTVEHLRRAQSSVTALARLDKTDWAHEAREGGSVGVPVTVSDAAGLEVTRAVVSFAVAARCG